jgi:hypothetical protein
MFIKEVFLSRMVVVTTHEMVKNITFIRLKLPTRSTKTTREEDTQCPNDASFRLNPKN